MEEALLLTQNALTTLIFCTLFSILVSGLTAHSFPKPLEVIPNSYVLSFPHTVKHQVLLNLPPEFC